MRRLHRFAWSLLGYNLLVILWGAYVRATGSGAGCGSSWPLCNGEIVPRAPRTETLIELSHRLTSGIDGLLVLLLAVWVFRRVPSGHRLRAAAGASLFFLVTEALLGAGLVRFELVADNDSGARAVAMALHLVNTFFLLAALTVTALWARPEEAGEGEPDGTGRPAPPWLRVPRGSTAGVCGAALAGLLLVAVSGAVTALGDTLFPGRAFRWEDLSAASHVLLRLRILHPTLAVGVGLVVVVAAVAVARRHRRPAVGGWAAAMAGIYLVQLAVGWVNVLLAAPVWMQLVHLLLADLLWIAAVAWTVRAVERQPAPARLRRHVPAVGSG